MKYLIWLLLATAAKADDDVWDDHEEDFTEEDEDYFNSRDDVADDCRTLGCSIAG